MHEHVCIQHVDIHMNVHMYACVDLGKYVCTPVPIPCFFHINSGRELDTLLHPVHYRRVSSQVPPAFPKR